MFTSTALVRLHSPASCLVKFGGIQAELGHSNWCFLNTKLATAVDKT